MKRFALVAAFVLVGCNSSDNHPTAEKPTVVVGEYEDCKIYYTQTLGPAPNVTWVRCKNEPKRVETKRTESCGKGCTRVVTTITEDETK
jgi:uncharacterized protein YcfL